MKKTKLFILPLALTLIGSTLASCGGTPRTEGELYICVYDGGYGTEWIQELARKYQEKTGIVVHADSDQSVLERLDSQMSNGSDYDIFMSHDIRWQQYAAAGQLAPLDDVYSRTVEGTSETFEERLVNGAAGLSQLEVNGETHYYKACYTQGAGGLVYNMDMFAANGWSVPQTYADLVTLCQTIVNANLAVPGETRKTVKPFVWSGSDRQYFWDYVVFEWWAQLAGLDKIDKIREYKGENGSYATGYEMYNPATNYAEFKQAYEMWYNLVAMNSSYSVDGSSGGNLLAAQSAFAKGEAAMMPYAQWAKLETENALDAELSFDIALMSTPKARTDSIAVNYLVGFGDSVVVPQNSPNIELAKDFIAYLATEEACYTFVEKSQGAFLAFDYNDIDLSGIEATNTFIKSIHDKLNSSTNFTLASTNPITYWNTNAVMPWVANEYYYNLAAQNPSSYTPTTVGDRIYATASSNWAAWLRNAGLN